MTRLEAYQLLLSHNEIGPKIYALSGLMRTAIVTILNDTLEFTHEQFDAHIGDMLLHKDRLPGWGLVDEILTAISARAKEGP